jgi:hypothetical protein
MELIMSTLVIWPAEIAGSGEPRRQSSFLQRLIQARESQARRYLKSHLGVLTGLTEGRLRDLGFDTEEIKFIRGA